MSYQPLKEETQEQYLKIWMHFSVGHFTQEQLAKLFECSQDTVLNAVRWSAEHKIQFSTPILAEAAKEAVEARLRELNNDLIRIKEGGAINWNAVIGIYRLIKENQELLWSMQGVIQNDNPFIVNATQIHQNFDYRLANESGEERRQEEKIRDTVDEWTIEQKKAVLLLITEIKSGAKIAINESNDMTTIQLSRNLDKEESLSP